MSNPKSASRSVFIDATSADLALDKLVKKMKILEDEINKGTLSGDKLNKKIKELDTTKQSIQNVQDQISKGLKPTFVQVENQVRQLRNELKRMSEDAPGYAAKFETFKNATSELNRMQTAISGVDKAQRSWMQDAKTVAFGVLIGNTVQSAIQSITSYFSGIVSGNAKLSDSFADVEKATGLTSAQVAELNSQLSKIDTRTTTEDLRQIAIGLGQIGEAANVDNVEAIDKIVVALGDEFGGGAKEITTVLSVLRNNLQDIKTGNYGDDVSKIGNALNVLGAEGLATAPVVTDFANRMAGIAGTFKLTSGEILGTSATFQELGINVERGATAFTKVLQKIAAEPEKFSKVAGLSVKEFTDLVNKDMLGAFNAVAVGARKAGSSNVVFAQILKELDADGSGAGEVLSKLSKNQELLTDKVTLATNALKSQDSITAEFNKKNTNLAASMEKLGKAINSAFANSTLIKIFGGIVDALTRLFEKSKDVTEQFKDQNKAVKDLENNTVPLINRVDQLQKKADELGGTTKLSKDEQVELNKAIVTIGNTIPGAITQFDKYGNAIGISTQKAREFINLQQAILKEKNRDAITDQQETLRKLQVDADAVFKSLNKRNASGDLVKEVFTSGSTTGVGTSSIEKLTDEEIRVRQTQLAELQERIKGVKGIIEELKGDNLKVPEVSKPLTTTTDLTTPAVNPFGNNDAADKVKKLREEYAKLSSDITETINKLSKSSFAFDFDKIFQEKIEAEKKINDLFAKNIITAPERDAELQKIQKQTELKIQKLNEDLQKNVKDKPVTIDVVPEVKEEDIEALRSSMKSFLSKLGEDDRNEAAKRALTLLKGDNRQKRDATVGDIDAAEQKELSNTELLESEKEVIREKYRQQRIEADRKFLDAELENIQTVLSYASQSLDILSKFNDAKANKENAALNKELKANDAKKAAYKRMLDAKGIDQTRYQQLVDALDKEADAKKEALEKKQNERKKKIAITQAIINGAIGVTKALDLGFPLSLIGIALAVATTAAEIATISSQKYGKGGILNGHSHDNGGMPVINRKTGKVEAEMEGGEVILSKKTVRNNWDYISPLLHTSMNEDGRRITPWWQTRSYQAINYPAIQNTFVQRRMFESGGVFNATNKDQQPAQTVVIKDDDTKAVMLAVLDRLNNPVAPVIDNVNVPLDKIDKARALKDRIQADSAFR